MNILELKKIEHSTKIGAECKYIEPNIIDNTVFAIDGEPIGFYLKEVPNKLKQLIAIANNEFNSDNVPKSLMDRSDVRQAQLKNPKLTRTEARKIGTAQMSTILGAVAPKAHFRRPYPTISSVHNVTSAKTFIKAMLLACKESENIIKEVLPQQYEKQKQLIETNAPKEFRFGNLFTSSISNYNIAAPFHLDTGNLQGTVNVIITKRRNSKGGCLHVPDYNATIEQADNSMLVYPAWRNIHGVTPIIPTKRGGYRNSLIFYPLKAFKKYL
tara:strand:+ start:1541 stop:2350 length:810 start_codon:yes stop_codon:yes gene_type:complete